MLFYCSRLRSESLVIFYWLKIFELLLFKHAFHCFNPIKLSIWLTFCDMSLYIYLYNVSFKPHSKEILVASCTVYMYIACVHAFREPSFYHAPKLMLSFSFLKFWQFNFSFWRRWPAMI